MKKYLKFIILGLIVILLIAFGVFRHFKNKVPLNEGYVNGNSAGNLYNAGLFCEKDGVIYFANPDDGNALYSKNKATGRTKRLCNDTVMYLNVDSHYVYYIRNNTKLSNGSSFFSYNNNSLCRIPKDGGNVVILDEAPCLYASLLGNYLYYMHYDTKDATTLYKVKIDGSEKPQQVLDHYVFTCCAKDRFFYFHGTDTDGWVHKFDTSSDTVSVSLDTNTYKPIVDGDWVYYIDPERNNGLSRSSLTTNEKQMLTNDSADCFNVSGNQIFYHRYAPGEGALCVIDIDGNNFAEIAPGNFEAINITTANLYFKRYGTNEIFEAPLSAPTSFHSFNPGK